MARGKYKGPKRGAGQKVRGNDNDDDEEELLRRRRTDSLLRAICPKNFDADHAFTILRYIKGTEHIGGAGRVACLRCMFSSLLFALGVAAVSQRPTP
jgi:hypothetical protein